MSLFDQDNFKWRETFFVMFRSTHRPELAKVLLELDKLGRYEVQDHVADEDGKLVSMTVLAPDDFSALDISYISGADVIDESNSLLEELVADGVTPEEREKIDNAATFDARFDVMHFQQIVEEDGDEEGMDLFDPSPAQGARTSLQVNRRHQR
ncbi:MAG: hypothetical protein R3C10_24390 [Pirellulales bacterium]